ncbi:gamma-glutamyl phosphate reductase [candidate division MSBL1 archaeon SCGC-AAA259M10]|uniref:Gamma-glutamyl phosphate reductase n=8 Tax=candidate division MSBL1 TaxID=215777 RepID=A0A133US39_9EURY|nr:gamma-glutamyl phosphate reductase [candidate division MSBL1 archaeon SCGC-AAA259D18]KXA95808.1 gamma-glutamyl phosphate reductase [candidate division MSBL1 archaeon SCGC-AAA259E19]KXA96803.1 gamma-glutamyl phosphate reductase [candidate division MSBL1 archaeon SCGC-AAA259J03]KXA97008.1 gamma-glutamyl phosphate reductase [candidate division MSBL1 archaeon SCGC-AAA259I14]KXB00093.1 gamma-glutamyl phosphate reductase [candidate division MSBL1 archaeon SCGC-AAA259M10]KXB00411.1 gamma-glutamyl 
MKDVKDRAAEAKQASLELANVTEEVRNEALEEAAAAIEENRPRILEANEEDVTEANKLLERGEYSQALVDRLKLSEEKIDSISRMIRSVSERDDPLNKTISARKLDEDLKLYKVSVPIGVVGSIFESRPDVLPQISSLCLKSGNAVILKGGSEAEKSNRVLYQIFKEATEGVGIPEEWIQLIEARREVRELLELHEKVDLLVPRGSKSFIKYIQDNSRIPVLGHAEGLCHTYVDKEADLEKALKISYDGKVQYPAVCNATETLLVHQEIAEDLLPELAEKYRKAGVELRGCERTRDILDQIDEATEEDWRTEYLDLIISIKVVDGIKEAIGHINKYGSKHTDAIVSQKGSRLLEFMTGVDSSSVMANASTRFSDGYRYGLGAEVGISTGKIHARGPVGLEGLTTSKYYLVGDGQIVGDYVESEGKTFEHGELSDTWKEESDSLRER